MIKKPKRDVVLIRVNIRAAREKLQRAANTDTPAELTADECAAILLASDGSYTHMECGWCGHLVRSPGQLERERAKWPDDSAPEHDPTCGWLRSVGL